MIFWLFAFLLILIVSIYLAYYSMKNFPQIPDERFEHGIFLVRSPQNFNSQTLKKIKDQLGEKIISVERLFKGEKKALVIFGPKNIVEKFTDLNLLELEDYSKDQTRNILAIEVGLQKNLSNIKPVSLSDDEQILYQIVLTNKNGDRFSAQMRAVLLAKHKDRCQNLADDFFSLNKSISKVVLPQTSTEIFQSFQKRLLLPLRKEKFDLKVDEIITLIYSA